jgi:hypothetical protein
MFLFFSEKQKHRKLNLNTRKIKYSMFKSQDKNIGISLYKEFKSEQAYTERTSKR